jgi:HlyD family secretion protein
VNRSRLGKLLALPLGAAVTAAVGYTGWLALQPPALEEQYRTAFVQRGTLTSAVAATGTVGAVLTVQVGSQVPGRITALHADFNTEVRRGQTLARIDPEPYELRILQARADVDAARTALSVAQNGVAALHVRLARARVAALDAQREAERKRTLVERAFIVPAEADRADAQHRDALEEIAAMEAQIALQEAQVENARAAVRQRETAMRQAQADLERTYVRAPVDGIVISRSADTGQNVAAGLGAGTLFTIARDLRDMQVDLAVGEADVGRLRVGQAATFTVDAFPRRTFEGRVVQIRKAPQRVEGGIAYTVVVSAPNADLALLPGMSARARVVVDAVATALKVPNDALRFRADADALEAATPRRVWKVGRDGRAVPIEVEVGVSDGAATEVVSGALEEGDAVVVGATTTLRRAVVGGR